VPGSDTSISLGNAPDGLGLAVQLQPPRGLGWALQELDRGVDAAHDRSRASALLAELRQIFCQSTFSTLADQPQQPWEILRHPVERLTGRTLLSRLLGFSPQRRDVTILAGRKSDPILFPAISYADKRLVLCQQIVAAAEGDEPIYRFVREFEPEDFWRIPSLREMTLFFGREHAPVLIPPDRDGYRAALLSIAEDDLLATAEPVASISRNAAATLVLQSLLSLQQIHARGRVHGDVKPDNILVTGSCTKMIDSGEHEFGATIYGISDVWAAPEQALGEAITAQTDQYPVGLMLLKLTGGVAAGPVLQGGAGFRADLALPYNPSVVFEDEYPGSSAHLWKRLIERCLRFRAEERFPSVSELIGELDQLCSTGPCEGYLSLPLKFGTLERSEAGVRWSVNPVEWYP
jgi:protein kinase-like protein